MRKGGLLATASNINEDDDNNNNNDVGAMSGWMEGALPAPMILFFVILPRNVDKDIPLNSKDTGNHCHQFLLFGINSPNCNGISRLPGAFRGQCLSLEAKTAARPQRAESRFVYEMFVGRLFRL